MRKVALIVIDEIHLLGEYSMLREREREREGEFHYTFFVRERVIQHMLLIHETPYLMLSHHPYLTEGQRNDLSGVSRIFHLSVCRNLVNLSLGV